MKDVRGLQINHLIFLSIVFVFAFLQTGAAFAGPNRTTYQAKIVKPDGYPLEASTVNFKFTILDPAGSCILYSETYSSVNMAGTGGLISFALGSGVKTYPTSATTTFEQVFSNITPSLACDVGGPANYSPAASDARKIVMQFHDGNGWQTLPAMSINAVPYAMYANSAQNLNGKTDADFVQVASLATCGVGEALHYNGVGFSCVTIPTPETVSGAAVVSALGYTPANSATVNALSSSLSSTDNNVASVSSTVASVSSAVASVSSTLFSVSSTVSSLSNTVSNLSTSVSNLSASMAAITSSQWVASGTSISYSSGNVGIGTNNPSRRLDVYAQAGNSNVMGLRTSDYVLGASGTTMTFQFGSAAGNTYSSINTLSNGGLLGNHLVLQESGNGKVGIGTTTPTARLDVSGAVRIGMDATSCTAGLAGSLRYNSGTVEYCNGASWLPFGVAGAGITNINGSTSGSQTFATGITGTVFNISSANGVHTFNIPLAASSSVTAGLLSNTDYLTFTNKLNATSAAVISALGYTPLDSSVSGTYAVKSNNLSDLTSSATARTNLGLGTLATLNYLDLGSALASGTLSVARLPAFSGDASSVAGSAVLTLASVGAGVTSGAQYTKVTVDGKGRVVSGAQLSSSDVVTALGYTPGAAASGVTSLNGSTSQTQTFANGSSGNTPAFNTSNGVHTLNIPLASATGSVTAGLISNADYLTFTNKLNATSAAVIAALGYTPANNSASGTYAQKANNLSDLASATVARTNLGLGSLATLNFLDLGTSLASGTLAAARLPAFSGDATSPLGSSVLTLASVGSGVTSGTQYTKVTVDGKGRVVSGSQLSSSDVATALGYTPVASGSLTSSQWISSGSAIYYDSGNVGLGALSPATRLHLAGGISADGQLRIETNNSTSTIGMDFWHGGGGRRGFVGMRGSGSSAPTPANYSLYLWSDHFGAPIIFGTQGIERMRLDSAGNLGVGVSSPVTRLDVSGGLKISMESATCAASYAGTLRYNGGNVEYCNGSTWTAFGAATVGVNTLNGSASQTQTFANGNTGNAPAFATANGVHTLNIPLASATGSVTAGLISNADYLNFSNKITSSAASIAQVLGYTPASATALGNYLVKANNLSDLTSVATARTNLGLGAFATANTIDLGSASATGTLAAARLPAFTGDVVSVSGSNSVTVDGLQGRAVATTAPSSGQVLAYNGSAWAPATNISSQWTTSGSAIYYNGGNVGIGTNAPAGMLDIAWGGASGLNGGADMNLSTRTNNTNKWFRYSQSQYANANAPFLAIMTGSTNTENGVYLGGGSALQPTATNIRFYTGTSQSANGSAVERMTILPSGNVGIGTTTPANTLDVSGTLSALKFTGSFMSVDNRAVVDTPESASSAGMLLNFKNNSANSLSDGGLYNGVITFRPYGNETDWSGGPSHQIGFTSNGNLFHRYGSSTTWNTWRRIIETDASGNVGIGTTTPDRNLSVVENTGSNGRGLSVRTYNTANTGGVIEVAGSLGTASAPLALTINKSLGFYTFAGYDGSSVVMQSIPTGMYSTATENWSAVSHGANLRFATTPNGATNGVERMRIDQNGYVGIGTAAPSVELEVSGTVKAAAYLYTSDRRLKKDIVTLPDALTKALQLRGVNFVWRNNEEKTVGFIAQEVEAVYPELVKTDKQSGFKAVQYGNIVAILVEALKQENKERVEAQNRCEAQVSQVQRAVASVDEKSSARMNQLEKENKELKERLDRLEKLLLKK